MVWYDIRKRRDKLIGNRRKVTVMTREEFIKTISSINNLYVVYSKLTRMPMVFCHEETMDDYIYVYENEQGALDKVKELFEDKIPAAVVQCKEKEVLAFFAELHLTGVNAVCFVVSEEEQFMVQLNEFLKMPDLATIPEDKRPTDNISLHLSMLYFVQEMRKPVDNKEKKNLAALEEETSANITRAKFIIPMNEIKEGENQGKKAVVLLKNDKGEVALPLFTDIAEIRKFSQGKSCPIATVDFQGVLNILQQGNAATVVINPTSSNVILGKQGVLALATRFAE